MHARTYFVLCGKLTVRTVFDIVFEGVSYLVITELNPSLGPNGGLMFTGYVMWVARKSHPDQNLIKDKTADELKLRFRTTDDPADQRRKLRRAFRRKKLI